MDPGPGTVIAAEDAAFGWRHGRKGVGRGRYFSQIISASCVELQCVEKAVGKTSRIRVEWGQDKGWLSPKQRTIISYRLIRFLCSSSFAAFLSFFLALISTSARNGQSSAHLSPFFLPTALVALLLVDPSTLSPELIYGLRPLVLPFRNL